MTDLVTIFCEIDDFCKEFEKNFEIKLLSAGSGVRKRSFRMSMSEVMTISIWYHYSGYGTFKDYYTKHVAVSMQTDFKLVSYTRFIELRKYATIPLLIFLTTKKLSASTGIAFIDSFKLEACHSKRSSSHKTLRSLACKGKTSVGWFFGMKVHLVINHQGQIISFYISSGNCADNNTQVLFNLTKALTGKLFGDKGYLVKKATFEKLYQKGVHLITKIRANMQNKLLEMADKLLLKKRAIIESVGDIMKNHLNMAHTRHRSSWAFFLHVFSSLIAYQFRDKKPNISRDLLNHLLPA